MKLLNPLPTLPKNTKKMKNKKGMKARHSFHCFINFFFGPQSQFCLVVFIYSINEKIVGFNYLISRD